MGQTFDLKSLSADQILGVLESRDLKDSIVDVRDLSVADCEFERDYMVLEQGHDLGGTTEHILSGNAIGQFLGRITPRMGNFPRHFITDPDLQRAVIQHRLEDYQKHPQRGEPNLLFRAFKGHGMEHYLTRAVLTTQYKVLNHDQVLANVLEHYPDLEVQRADVGWDDMFLSFAAADQEPVEVRVGDLVNIGFTCYNGETGGRSLGFETFAMRLVCSNGMTAKEGQFGIHHRHVGNLDKKVRKGIEQVIHQAGQLESLLKDAAGLQVAIEDPTRGIEQVYEQVIKASKLPKSLLDSLVEAHKADELDEADWSVFGVVNGLTRVARDVKDTDRRRDYETLAMSIAANPTQYGIALLE